MNAFLYAQSDGFEVRSDRIMGRQVSGRGFLAANLREEPTGILVPGPREIAGVEAFAATIPGAAATVVTDIEDPRLIKSGALSCFDVSKLIEYAWRRRDRGVPISITGLTHSISDPVSLDLIGALIEAPVFAHDALVCTSRATRMAVEFLLDAKEAYIAERVGGSRKCPRPQLPVIPLGVDLDDFYPSGAPALRRQWRERLSIAESDVAALYFGRIAFHAKAHPLPLYVGLQEAARAAGRKIHLIEAGWFPNPEIEAEFALAARQLAPDVTRHVLDGRNTEIRREIWYAADFFTSLSDTIEESFGLTPLEAMAAGLPAVVSDWDGYRDTVRDGVTGFLVPSTMPPPGSGAEIARRHAWNEIDFDSYEGFAGLGISIDVSHAAESFGRLAGDAGLRRKMGEAARVHVAENFAWSKITARHRELWRDLEERRRAAGPLAPAPPPLRQDPYAIFAGHATRRLAPDLRLMARRLDAPYMDKIAGLHMNVYGRTEVAPNPLTIQILALFEKKPGWTVAEIIASCDAASEPAIYRALGWILKMGLVELVRS